LKNPITTPVEEEVIGTSLWKDAWRRLRKNRLAIVGMVVVSIVIAASIVGPPLIRAVTGYTYDSIPTDSALIKSFPPFTAPDGSFSWAHPMGTDIAGRDILARVLLGGRISLMVGIISTFVSLIIGITFGATAGYLGGKIDEVMMRIVDVLYAIPYMMVVIVLLAFFGGQSPLGQLFLLFAALGAVSWLTMARIVRGQVISLKNQEFTRAGDRVRDAHDSIRHAARSLSVVPRTRRTGAARVVGQLGGGRHSKHRDLSMAAPVSWHHDGHHAVLPEFHGRRAA
jgi:oligopeptide transport system permease protein